MENKITTAAEWQAALSAATTPGKADTLSRFFKTGKGEYGEGDKFIGVMVPANRQIAKQTLDAPLQTVAEMLASEIHEHRLSALLSLVERYRKARKDPAEKHRIAQFYLTHTDGINNWDLVDLSAPYIIGDQIMEGNDPTPRLLDSANLWEQRIAVVSTMLPIRNSQFDTALRNVGHLLQHPHDLLQKANGWMLRETGKRDISTLLRRPPRSHNATHNAALCHRTACSRAKETLYEYEKAHIQQFIKIKLQKKFRDFVAISEKIYTFAQNFKKAERRLYK